MSKQRSRAWIQNPHRNSDEYIQGVRYFMSFVKYHSSPDFEFCSCPCKKCRNAKRFPFETVQKHLIIFGMDPTYDEWFFHGETDAASLEDFENGSIPLVFGSDKKRSNCCVISSSASAKQAKTTLATKASAKRKDREELRLWKEEIQSNMTPRTEASSTKKGTSIIINSSGSPTDEVVSSSNEKQYVKLLSRNMAEVAEGFTETRTNCHDREAVQNGEKVVCITEIIDPEAPIFDGPQNGKYKLCDIGNGGHVIWPMYRLRNL